MEDVKKISIFELIDKKKYEALTRGLKNNTLDRLNMAGIPPIVYAVQKKDLTALKILLKYEAVDDVDQDNKTALHYAVSTNQVLAVKYLLENGASTTIKDVDGKDASQATSGDTDRSIMDMIKEKHNI
jgi:Ankyrin repeat.